MQKCATPDGTKRFEGRQESLLSDFYNDVHDLRLSSLGLGTFAPEPYREENYLYSFTESLVEGVRQGCNVIDTAINYRCQQSEKEIADALKILFDTYGYQRDELFVMSKAGFIPLEFPFPENPYTWIDEKMLTPGLAKKEEIITDQHCLSSEFLRWSVEQSLQNLELGCLDLLFLHNPETQLGYTDRNVLLNRVKEAFIACESLVSEGKIVQYGIASWNAFLYEESHMEYLSLHEMVQLAEEAGGKTHHFKAIQLPYNLAKPHPQTYTNQKLEDGLYYTSFQAARKLGLSVFTSSSLLRMNLFKRPFSSRIGALLGEYEMSDVHRALQFCRSSGFVDCALFSSKEAEHMRHDLMLARLPRANPAEYARIFEL